MTQAMDEIQVGEETAHRPRLSSQRIDMQVKPDVQHTHQKRFLVSKLLTIEDPEQLAALKTQHSNVRLSLFEKLRIEKLRRRLGQQTSTETIRSLLDRYDDDSTGIIPTLTDELFGEAHGTPLVLTGRPGAGKTLTVKSLKTEPLLLLDLANEHAEISKKLSLQSLLSYNKWSKHGRMRFVPSENRQLGTLEVKTLIEFLNQTKYDGRYKTWSIAIEEGHRIHRMPPAISLILEGRKYFKRLLVVCADETLFPACLPVKPKPPSELLKN